MHQIDYNDVIKHHQQIRQQDIQKPSQIVDLQEDDILRKNFVMTINKSFSSPAVAQQSI